MAEWRFLAVRLLLAPFVVEHRFVDLELETTQGDIDHAILDAVDRYEGMVIDSAWTYAATQRWLYRSGDEGIVLLDEPLPAHLSSRWQVPPPLTPEKYSWVRNRIIAITLAVTSLIGLGGLAAWSRSGDSEVLVAALFYVVLIGGAVVAGLIIAKRKLLPKS